MAISFGDVLKGIGAAFAGRSAGKQQAFENEQAMATQALNTERVNADVAAQQAQVQLQQQQAQREDDRYKANVMTQQLTEAKNAVAAGALDANDPNTKNAIDAIYAQYKPLAEKLIGNNFKLPDSTWVPRRVVTSQDMATVASFAPTIDWSNPDQLKSVSTATGISTSALTALGSSKMTAPQKADYELRIRQLDQDKQQFAVKSLLDTFTNKNILALKPDDQKQTFAAILTVGGIEPDTAGYMASKIPDLKNSITPDVAAQLGVQTYGINADIAMNAAKIKSSERVAGMEIGSNEKIAAMRVASDQRIAELQMMASGQKAAKPVDIDKARKDLRDAYVMLNDPTKRQDALSMDNLQNLIASNLAVISAGELGPNQIVDPDFLANLVKADPKPAKDNPNSLAVWQGAKKTMLQLNWTPKMIQWVYNQRYSPVFGRKSVVDMPKSSSNKLPVLPSTKSIPKGSVTVSPRRGSMPPYPIMR